MTGSQEIPAQSKAGHAQGPSAGSALLYVANGALMAAIFGFDALEERGVAAGVLYVAVVVFSASIPGMRSTLGFGVAATALVMLDYFVSPPGGELWKVVANRLLAMFAIWMTAALVMVQKHLGTQRDETDEALRRNEEVVRLLLGSLGAAVVTIDADSRILSANPALEKLFGYPRTELVGQPLTILMPESLQARHTAGLRRYIESGERGVPWSGLRLKGRHQSGNEISLEISFSEFVSNGTRVFAGVIHAITEQVSQERDLQVSRLENETLEKLKEFTAKVDSGLTLEEVLDQVFESFQTVIPYDRMGCGLLEDAGQTLRAVWSRSALPEVHIPVGYSAPMEGSSLLAILASGRPRILNDLEAHLREHPDSENTRRIVAEGVRSSLACPLITRGKPVGFLFFSSTRPGTYDASHVDLYLRIAGHLSIMIEKGRLYQQLTDTKIEAEAQGAKVSDMFGRYAGDAIVSHLMGTPDSLEMRGEIRKVTIVFADLRGFNALCAALAPRRLVRLLNIFFSAMTDVVMSHGGTIDEFVGDAVLANFGAPSFSPDDARRALACSIDMQRAMGKVNEQLLDEGLPAVELDIAVHTGPVVVGSIGSKKRAKYGLVGPAVNLVIKMEGHANNGEILCSEDTLREAGDIVDFEERGDITPKGLNERVRIVCVRGLRARPVGEAIDPSSSDRVDASTADFIGSLDS